MVMVSLGWPRGEGPKCQSLVNVRRSAESWGETEKRGCTENAANRRGSPQIAAHSPEFESLSRSLFSRCF